MNRRDSLTVICLLFVFDYSNQMTTNATSTPPGYNNTSTELTTTAGNSSSTTPISPTSQPSNSTQISSTNSVGSTEKVTTSTTQPQLAGTTVKEKDEQEMSNQEMNNRWMKQYPQWTEAAMKTKKEFRDKVEVAWWIIGGIVLAYGIGVIAYQIVDIRQCQKREHYEKLERSRTEEERNRAEFTALEESPATLG